jgi:nucleoside-diphosphate-sugar epimerase
MSRVLGTGASGFLGTHLIEHLLEGGDEVTALVRATSNVARLAALSVRLVHGDVTDAQAVREAVAGQDAVYHLAGLTMALRAADFARVNEGGTRIVAEACAAQTTPPVLVVASSIAASGPNRAAAPRSERDPPRPVSNYGRSKLAAERAARRLAGQVPVTIVRPPIVVGEGDRATLPLFTSISRWGVHMVPTIRAQRYSLIHAADLARAFALVARHGARLVPDAGAEDGSPDAARGVYFAAADEAPTYGQLGRLIADAIGRRSVLVSPNSAPAIWGIAATTELVARLRRRPLIFNLDKAREARAGSWVCSDAALRRDVGFAPALSLAERLRQTAQWYAEQGLIRLR